MFFKLLVLLETLSTPNVEHFDLEDEGLVVILSQIQRLKQIKPV